MRSSKAPGFWIIILSALASVSVVLSVSLCSAACAKTESLFIIERSKNRNIVHYDLCIGKDGYPSGAKSVVVYWMLENGQREELSKLDRQLAYGIVEYKKIGKGVVRIFLASVRERAITIERLGRRYTATILINGKESILDKVYVKSQELIVGLPRVQSIELFGRTKGDGLPVNEKIVP